jgi:hypothetical protein
MINLPEGSYGKITKVNFFEVIVSILAHWYTQILTSIDLRKDQIWNFEHLFTKIQIQFASYDSL